VIQDDQYVVKWYMVLSERKFQMTYVDGFVAAVPTENKEKFIQHAKIAADVVIECGALKAVECWGDDVPDGKLTSLPMAVKKNDNETVVFSWIIWPDKTTRNRGMKQMMEDPRMQPDVNPMPFDGKRCIFGGFQTIFES
jgi:uncharacterized protein YbaA (DUF1428 family)